MEITMEQVRTAIENATEYRAGDVIKLTFKGRAENFKEHSRFSSVRDAFGDRRQATVADLTLRVANSPWAQKLLRTGKKRTVSDFIRDVALKAVGGFCRRTYGKLV